MAPTFNEILGMRLDFTGFLQDFEKFKLEYQKKIQSLDQLEISPKATKILNTIGVANLNKEISKLGQSFSNFAKVVDDKFSAPIIVGAANASKALQDLQAKAGQAFDPIKKFKPKDLAADSEDLVDITRLEIELGSQLNLVLQHRQELLKSGTDVTEQNKQIELLNKELALLREITVEQEKSIDAAVTPPLIKKLKGDLKALKEELKTLQSANNVNVKVDQKALDQIISLEGQLKELQASLAASKIKFDQLTNSAANVQRSSRISSLTKEAQELEAKLADTKSKIDAIRIGSGQKGPVLLESLISQAGLLRRQINDLSEPIRRLQVNLENAFSVKLKAGIAELDKLGAPDSKFRELLSTGSKAPLKKGETFRGRALQFLESAEKSTAQARQELDALLKQSKELEAELLNLNKAIAKLGQPGSPETAKELERLQEQAVAILENLKKVNGELKKLESAPLAPVNQKEAQQTQLLIDETTKKIAELQEKLLVLKKDNQIDLKTAPADLNKISALTAQIKDLEDSLKKLKATVKKEGTPAEIVKGPPAGAGGTGGGGIGGNQGEFVKNSREIAAEQLRLVRAGKLFEEVEEGIIHRQADFRQLSFETQEILFKDISQSIEKGGVITFDKLTQLNQKWFSDQQAIRAKDDSAYAQFIAKREQITTDSLGKLTNLQNQFSEIQAKKQDAITRLNTLQDTGGSQRDIRRAEQSVQAFTEAEQAKRKEIELTKDFISNAFRFENQKDVENAEKVITRAQLVADRKRQIAIRSEHVTSDAIERVRENELSSEQARLLKKSKLQGIINKADRESVKLKETSQAALDAVSKASSTINIDVFKKDLAELDTLVQTSLQARLKLDETFAQLTTAISHETSAAKIQDIRNVMSEDLLAFNQSVKNAEKFSKKIVGEVDTSVKNRGLTPEELQNEKEKANVIKESTEGLNQLAIRHAETKTQLLEREAELNKAVQEKESKQLIQALEDRLTATKRYFEAIEAMQRVHQEKLNNAKAQGPGVFNQTPQLAVDFDKASKALGRTNTAMATSENRLANIQGRTNSIANTFKSFGEEVLQSAKAVIKFSLLWNLVGLAIEAAQLPFKFLLDGLSRGIKFLTEFQQKTIEVREVLLQNAKFANDLTENFELANVAARKVALAIELASTKVNTSSQVFQQVLESFIQGGGLQAVGGDLNQAVDSVALLLQALGSVGIGLKDARRAVSEVNKLLTQGVTARDALPRAFKLSADQLSALSNKAAKQGKLFQFLENSLSNQAKTLELSDASFGRILDKVELFTNLISGAFAQTTFDVLLKSLQDITKFFEKNNKEILEFFKALGAPLGNVLQGFISLSKAIAQIPFALGILKRAVEGVFPPLFLLEHLLTGITEAFKVMGTASEEAADRLTGAFKTNSLNLGDSIDLSQFREKLLNEVGDIDNELKKNASELDKNLSAEAEKALVTSSKALFDKRKELIEQVTKSDEILSKLPIATNFVGFKDFIDRHFNDELRKAERTIPPEVAKLLSKTNEQFESGLARGEAIINAKIADIKNGFKLLATVSEEIESGFRERIDTRFQAKAISEAQRSQQLMESFERGFTDTLENIAAERRKLFGDVTDVDEFNSQFERVNNVINFATKELKESQVAVKKLTGISTVLKVPLSLAPKGGKIITPEQKQALEKTLSDAQKELDALNVKKKASEGLGKEIDEQRVLQRELDIRRIEAEKKRDKAIEGLRQESAAFQVKIHNKQLDAELDKTKTNLQQQEQLFQLNTQVRTVDEAEAAEEAARTHIAALSAELKTVLQKKQESALKEDKQAADIRAGQIVKEIEFTQELTNIRVNIGLAQRKAAEEKANDEIIRARQDTANQLFQIAVSNQERTQVQLIDAQKDFLQLQRDQDIAELDRRIKIAKDKDPRNFDKSGEFARQRKKIEEDFTNAVKLNADERARAIIQRERDIRQAAIETLNIRKKTIEALNSAQEKGFVVERQILDNQLRLATSTREIADANVEAARTELERLKIRSQDTLAIEKQRQALEALRNEQLQARIEEEAARRAAAKGARTRIIQAVTGRDRTQDNLARDVIGKIIGELQSEQEKALANKDFGEFERLEEQIERLRKEFVRLNDETKKVGFQKFATDLIGVVNTVQSGINAVIQGFQQSGVGGAIGGGLSFAGNLPGVKDTIVGQALQVAGAITSAISGLFKALARRLAESIKKAFDKILQDFEDGARNLGNTIVALQAKREEAIKRLSGKKGGKEELDKLLPDFDKSIKDLLKQQKDIRDAFEDQLSVLRLGNDSLVEFNRKWKDVVDTVKEYLDSFADGEDLITAQAKAAEFLSLSLKKIRADFEEQLRDSEKDAIQDAIKLNDLLEEREKLLKEIVKLQEDFNKAQFDLLTADAREKRTAGVVERGNQIVQLRKEFEDAKKEKEDRLKELNQEIAFQARIVAAQREQFNLATGTAALKARSNQLEEESLQRQLDKIKEIKAVVDGIKQGPNGLFTIDPALLAAAGINPNTLNPQTIRTTTIVNPVFNIMVPEGVDGATFGRDMLGSWQDEQSRFGFNNS